MPQTGEEDIDYAERLAANADVMKDAWQSTIDDARAMAEELEEEGWDTLLIPAGHTAPENPDSGNYDRFGLAHVIPDNKADEFEEAFEAGEFPKYEVYRAEVQGRVFLVTVLLDPDTETAILLLGNYELRHAHGCVAAAEENDEMYTHVQTLDETHLGTFRHEDYTKFFPNSERIDDWQAYGEEASPVDDTGDESDDAE